MIFFFVVVYAALIFKNDLCHITDLEGKTDMKIRALELVEEMRTKRADLQVCDHVLCYLSRLVMY